MTTEWYYQIMGETVGPFSAAQIHKKVQSGEITADTWVRSGDQGDWVIADSVPGLIPDTILFSSPVPPIVIDDQQSPGAERYCDIVVHPKIVHGRTYMRITALAAIAITIVIAGSAVYLLKRSNVKDSSTVMSPPAVSSSAQSRRNRPTERVAASPPRPVDFDIQGMRIGDRLTDEMARDLFWGKDRSRPDFNGIKSIDIDGKSVDIFLQFDEYRLIGVLLHFDSDAYDSVVDAYTKKFGTPPHDIETAPVTTRIGVTYMNITASWITTSGPFSISKYGDTVDKGSARLDTPESRKYWENKRSEDVDALRNKL